MSQHKKILIFGSLILLIQIFIFRDYLSPFQWGQIKVFGQICDCPDERLVNGEFYLEFYSPDSFDKYDIDFSQVYVNQRPKSEYDPFGDGLYILEGKITGIQREDAEGRWYPEFFVEDWREVDIEVDWFFKGFFIIQLIVFGFLLMSDEGKKQELNSDENEN